MAAGLVFLPRAAEKAACARRLLATSLAAYGFEVARWSNVPAGDTARRCLFHVTLESRRGIGELQQRLDTARRESVDRAKAYGISDFQVAALTPA